MTSFPPPDFVPAASAVDGIEVYKPAPPRQEAHRPVVEFDCPQCGANTAYSAADGGLTCTHCGYFEPPKQAVVGKGAAEFEFTVETMERAAHGWGQARQELQCQSCGAYTSVPTGSLTHTCPFCASNKVIQGQAPQDLLRPRFLIPFTVDAEACRGIVREWLGSSWMTPGALRQLASFGALSGIYLPFWTFDAITQADWRAEVAHTKTERYFSASEGKWKTRTRTVWRWESGHVELDVDDLLVEGTNRLSALLLNQIKRYDLRQLAPYEPEYLAGFQAKAYDVSLEESWALARRHMREQTRQACRRQASNSRMRNFSMQLDFSHERWRYILLPVYLATYRYADRAYQVVVNGQTGAIAGQRPVDWLKVGLAVAGLLAPGLILSLIGLLLLSGREVGGLLGMAGLMLLLVGFGIGVAQVQRAMRLDDA